MQRFGAIGQELAAAPPPLAAAVWGARDATRRLTGVLDRGAFRLGQLKHPWVCDALAAEVTLPSGAAVHYAYKTNSVEVLGEKVSADIRARFEKLGWRKFWGVEELGKPELRAPADVQLLSLTESNSEGWSIVPSSMVDNNPRKDVIEVQLNCKCAGIAQSAGGDVAVTFLPQMFDDSNRIRFALIKSSANWAGHFGPKMIFGNDLEGIFWHYRSLGDALSAKVVGRQLLINCLNATDAGAPLEPRSLVSIAAFGIEFANVDELRKAIKVFRAADSSSWDTGPLISILELKNALADENEVISSRTAKSAAFDFTSRPWLGWALKDCSELMADLRDSELEQSDVARAWLERYNDWARNLRRVSSNTYLVDGRGSSGSLGTILSDLKKKLRNLEARPQTSDAPTEKSWTSSHSKSARSRDAVGQKPARSARHKLSHYDLIRRPVISEKSTRLLEANKVAFEVVPNATKTEIKAAVEALFNVKVASVNTLVRKGKMRTFRGLSSRQVDVKRAIVTLESGYSLDVTTGL